VETHQEWKDINDPKTQAIHHTTIHMGPYKYLHSRFAPKVKIVKPCPRAFAGFSGRRMQKFPAFVLDLPVILFGSRGCSKMISSFYSSGPDMSYSRKMIVAASQVSGEGTKFSKARIWEKNWQGPETSISQDDLLYVTNALGYKPLNAVSVANRTASGKPAVLQCYPLAPSKDGPEPFPTLFWLCDPDAKTKIAALEYAGTIVALKERLVENPSFFEEMRRCHQAYADERWALLRDSDRLRVQQSGWETRLRKTGIGGMRPEGYVKCLHIHYAHYLARSVRHALLATTFTSAARRNVNHTCRPKDNLVGSWVQSLLDAM
jgi:uncharacterized protein